MQWGCVDSFLYHSYKFCNVSILEFTDPNTRIPFWKGLKNKTALLSGKKHGTQAVLRLQQRPLLRKDLRYKSHASLPPPRPPPRPPPWHRALPTAGAQWMPHEWQEPPTSKRVSERLLSKRTKVQENTCPPRGDVSISTQDSFRHTVGMAS